MGGRCRLLCPERPGGRKEVLAAIPTCPRLPTPVPKGISECWDPGPGMAIKVDLPALRSGSQLRGSQRGCRKAPSPLPARLFHVSSAGSVAFLPQRPGLETATWCFLGPWSPLLCPQRLLPPVLLAGGLPQLPLLTPKSSSPKSFLLGCGSWVGRGAQWGWAAGGGSEAQGGEGAWASPADSGFQAPWQLLSSLGWWQSGAGDKGLLPEFCRQARQGPLLLSLPQRPGPRAASGESACFPSFLPSLPKGPEAGRAGPGRPLVAYVGAGESRETRLSLLS